MNRARAALEEMAKAQGIHWMPATWKPKSKPRYPGDKAARSALKRRKRK